MTTPTTEATALPSEDRLTAVRVAWRNVARAMERWGFSGPCADAVRALDTESMVSGVLQIRSAVAEEVCTWAVSYNNGASELRAAVDAYYDAVEAFAAVEVVS